MTVGFNAEEILEIAIKLEQKGASLYRFAALNAESPDAKLFFQQLARMEEEHEQIFRNFRDNWGKAGAVEKVFDPDEDAVKVLQAWADGFVFEISSDTTPPLVGEALEKEIFRVAIQAEKDSIVFYEGLRSGIKNPEDLAAVEEVIRQEMGHIVELSVLRSRLRSG
ncbi:MAG: ferritin family protein [Planctomycetota bacterium]|jgi:rubrerythrin